MVQEELASFLAQAGTHTKSNVRDFVKDELDAILERGIPAHGFLRLRCGECAHEKRAAFSCK